MILHYRSAIVALGIVLTASMAHAQTASLGNTASGLSDGDTPGILTIAAAQAGQPTPFDAGNGNEVLGPNFSVAYTFNYAPTVDPIVSAVFEIGIFDHDSAASGSQLLLLSIDGEDLTSLMDIQFEASGGGDNEYNVYSINLPGSIFADLADGVANVVLDLDGPGQQTNILLGGVSETTTNAAHLIYSTLDISAPAVPTPAALPVGLIGLGALAMRRRRRSA